MIKNSIAIDVRELAEKPAGVGRVISSLIKAMVKLNNSREYILLGYTNQDCSIPQGKFYPIKASKYFWHLECARQLKYNDWDILLALRSPIVPVLVPEKSIVFIHDLISFKYPEHFSVKTKIVSRLFTKLSIQRARGIVTFSCSTAKDIIKLCPQAESKIHIIPEAANEIFRQTKTDKAILKKYNINTPYILQVGTIEPRKNHLTLLSAYHALPEALRKKYKLVIVGKRGWECGHIIKKINESEKLESARYLEFVPDSDLVHIYNGASLFVYPSLYEGFGLPVVEAMRCGVPVITSGISSLPEVGGAAAFYIDPYKYEDISATMVKVLTNPALARKMAIMGLEQSKIFTWEKAARKLLNIIDNI